MTAPAGDLELLRRAANQYNLCLNNISCLSVENFSLLVHVAISYVNSVIATNQNDTADAASCLSTEAWHQAPDVCNVLKRVIGFVISCHEKSTESARVLLEVTLCIGMLTSGLPAAVDGSASDVLLIRRLDDIVKFWQNAPKDISDAWDVLVEFSHWIWLHGLVLKPIIALRYGRRCADEIKNYTSEVDDEEQHIFLADLRNAFRSHFHEERDKFGLSSVDSLNLSLRLNLFLSRYSKCVQRVSPNNPETRYAPFYPFMALAQSSGSGKSRLLREVGHYLPLIYGNLSPRGSKGYPFPNEKLRDYLLVQDISQGGPINLDSDQCEFRCQQLLLVAVIVFYLLFSSPDDRRKRITLPETTHLRKRAEDLGWRPAGIYEPDVDGSCDREDLFWNAVVAVTHTFSTNNEKDSRAGWYAKADIRKLEKELRHFGKDMNSPKGQNTSNGLFGDTTGCEVASEDSRTPGTEWQRSTGQKLEDLVVAIEKYIRIRKRRNDESLEKIAQSLQHIEPSLQADDATDVYGLCAMFIALDESQALAKYNVRSKRKSSDLVNHDEYVSILRCLRRVAHEMREKTGVNIFLLFSDTTAKLADFVPQRSQDPSARIMMDTKAHEIPGQPHAPFVNLRTESAGLMVVPKDRFDFPNRLKKFCDSWHRPNIDQDVETVTEELTSIPFDVLREQSVNLNKGMDREIESAGGGTVEKDEETLADSNSELVAAFEKGRGATLFRREEDYVYLGRPLWASTMINNRKLASWKVMVIFALEKLLGGTLRMCMGEPQYEKQCLALLACRVPLQFVQCTGIAPQLVAEHMAWCTAVSWDRESVYFEYINEPLLAAAASVVWSKDLAKILQCLVVRCGTYLSSKGELGETAACVWLIDAMDIAYKNMSEEGIARNVDTESDQIVAANTPGRGESQRVAQKTREGSVSPAKKLYWEGLADLPKGLTLHGVVTLRGFLESAFWLAVEVDYSVGSVTGVPGPVEHCGDSRPVVGYAWKQNDPLESTMSERAIAYVPELLASAEMRFKSIKRARATIGCRDIPFLFEANVAVLTKSYQKGVDVVIPLRLCIQDRNGEDKHGWSCLTVQVKNKQESPYAFMIAGRHLDPVWTGTVKCDAVNAEPCPRCVFMSDNHFGIAVNVHDGKVNTFEKKMGPLWTFLTPNAVEKYQETAQNLSHLREKKKRRLEQSGRVGKQTYCSGTGSASLIINGLLDGASRHGGSRCDPNVLLQIRNLIAQDNFPGVIARRTEQQLSALDELEQVSSSADPESVILPRAVASAKQRVRDEHESYERKA